MEEQRARDAAEGHEIAIKLEGKISRKVGTECMGKGSDIIAPCFYMLKVVKQTVMTVVYGVTWVGGRLQIAVSYNIVEVITYRD